jgi:PAS domain S-box-containing protein
MRCGDVVEAMQLGLHVYALEDPADEGSLRLVQANPASERLTGLRGADLVGRTLDENFPEARPRGVPRRCAEVITTQSPAEIEVNLADRGTGRKLTFLVKVFPLSGQCVGVLFENITRRRAVERSLERTTRFLDSIIDNMPTLIFIKDAEELRYLRLNAEMERALGVRKEEIVGRTDHEVFPKERADRFVAVDRQVLATGEIASLPEETELVDGKGERVFQTRKVPIYDEAGRPLYVLGLTEDVTGRRAAEEARRNELVLLEAQARLLDLVRELSTPLLPVLEGVLVAPIVGQVDAARGAHFLEALLAGIERHRAETVILDVTGVPAIDADVAAALLRATRAAGLLGTSCALVGVSPEVARALVALEVDLGGIRTHRDLQAGVLDALARRGRGGGIRTGAGG